MNLERARPPYVAIGILAWNEADAIGATFRSLFRQSLFEELCRRNLTCEIVCIANGCTDATAAVARKSFHEYGNRHARKGVFTCRVLEIKKPGKTNAWNVFVHKHLPAGTQLLFFMDGDIVFHHPDTLRNMFLALLKHPNASVSVDRPVKDLSLKPRKTLRDRLSLATSRMTQTGAAQLTGQLYCIRAAVARRIYFPRDLAVEDGFLKTVICTDFFTNRMNPARVVIAPDAAHIFEAYMSLPQILNNQKRQMIAQTTAHVLIEHLKSRPLRERVNLAATLKRYDTENPGWLKQLLSEHLRRTRFFWRLFPDALTFRFRRWWKMRGLKRLTHFLPALAGFGVTMIACFRARHHFKHGRMHYWPKPGRTHQPVLPETKLRPAFHPLSAPPAMSPLASSKHG